MRLFHGSVVIYLDMVACMRIHSSTFKVYHSMSTLMEFVKWQSLIAKYLDSLGSSNSTRRSFRPRMISYFEILPGPMFSPIFTNARSPAIFRMQQGACLLVRYLTRQVSFHHWKEYRTKDKYEEKHCGKISGSQSVV